ncbi:MAG TPA: Pycsar system effector family protein [Flavobacterium sp.]|jgi:hypothetical protein
MDEKIEHLKFIIGRFDNYIESTQAKANLYLALNTAILAGIITLLTTQKPDDRDMYVKVVLGFTALLALVSITVTLLAITPYLKSISIKGNSMMFFEEVKNMSYEEYHDKIEKISEAKFLKDLSCQAYSLASGLVSKYRNLMVAGRIIIAEFILLFICVIFFITKSL